MFIFESFQDFIPAKEYVWSYHCETFYIIISKISSQANLFPSIYLTHIYTRIWVC